MNQIVFGDCRASMRQFIDEGRKVQLCVTSPPYFGPRDYGHDGQIGLEQRVHKSTGGGVRPFHGIGHYCGGGGKAWPEILGL